MSCEAQRSAELLADGAHGLAGATALQLSFFDGSILSMVWIIPPPAEQGHKGRLN